MSPISKRVRLAAPLSCVMLGTLPAMSLANQVKITASADADVIVQNVDSDSQGEGTLNTLSLKPRFNAAYQSRTFLGNFSGALTHLNRDNNDNSQSDNYAEYSYSANWLAIERLLSFQASGGISYRNANASNFLVSDFLANEQDLAKTQTNRIASNLTMEQGDWVRASASVSYAKVDSEQNLTAGFAGLDSTSSSARASLRNGDEAKILIWSVTGGYQNTERNTAAQGDFVSQDANGYLDTMLLGNWGLRLTASHESNEVSDVTGSETYVREFDSYGVGLTYRQSENRYLSVTANQSQSDLDEAGDDTFVGIDLRWAFSPRTSLDARYGRRFYGESASGALNYNTKYLRSSLSYSEDITNSSRLLSDPILLGLLVCPYGDNATLTACYLPDNLDYTPQSGEQVFVINSENFELDDNIVLRKSANGQVNYQFSRLTFGLFAQHTEEDYLDQDRFRTTMAAGINASFSVGQHTHINASVRFADIEQQSATFSNGNSQNTNASFGLERQFGRYLVSSLDVSLVKKNGDLTDSYFGANYEDRRLTLGIRYTYE
ncbi:TIGR03016 family PEP-CTERM system-associated outer membrane protein [Alteromonas aestuariivivens]|uniref:TIGR03016 family PEP-CTERM system-associated outer membrane protein n=1 Tax=Alteromonas aestuariivivens TaxID=1938339 RepID=A0A3D8MF40_9ALTE|nr:TIGR03016 family PEP-CTERM system-associated outer membrane protein [Alteromonas aestuariivivens]RDV29181.1 TIGR03016 family PEP-CTERM system-associated outer membrane protein [Alteromonas aestuariivivens]